MGAKEDSWEALQAIFDRARDLEGDERLAFLDQACGEDTALRQELDQLLAVDLPEDFLAAPSAPAALGKAFGGNLTGAVLGEFEIERELGRGGMGVVFLARQPALERSVALKVLPPIRRVDRVAVERFRREAIAASRIHHPAIARVITAGEDQGLLYFAMEYVPGGSVADAADELFGRLGGAGVERHRAVARFMADVAEGLAAAHEKGVVHRDIKPGNVLVGVDGRPRIVDFGLAQLVDLDRLTQSGLPAGTFDYMSPEQARARRSLIDFRTDIYSAGAMLYDLLTGRPPIRGTSVTDTLRRIDRDDPRPPSAVQAGIPSALDAVCMMALRKERDDRYQSALDLAADLRRFAQGQPVRAKSEPIRRRVGRGLRRRRGTIAIASTVALLATSGLFAQNVRAAYLGRTAAVAFELASGATARVEVERAGSLPRLREPTGRSIDLRGSRQVRLDPGAYWFVVEVGDSRFEFDRALAAGDSALVLVPDAATLPSREGMVAIERGQATYATRLGPIVDGAPGEMGPIVETVAHGAFLIDRSPVSSGEYYDWLEAESPGRGEAWSRRIRSTAPEHWRELPATSLSYGEARAFAEAHGKRLPRRVEWCAAALGAEEEWFTELLATDRVDDLAIGGPALLDSDGEIAPVREAAAFVRYVVPGGSEPLGPLGLTNLVGGVQEWTCEAAPVDPAIEGIASLHMQGIIGTRWSTSRDVLEPLLLTQLGFAPPDQIDMGIGFRCVIPLE
ncbi:bifunctional serine/threonine-protein kinase/formylglycine-generating enzyme family protein [Engelhardtia mirabilis]|uniref:Serine/threonine-protein kinase PknB n=1 Tax=Engelhardtia mirabilis TaxID=2528011 RepID=A0A518BFC0_9BACT|nr:Serine/threonine-protein kinase PknB [Planctomycetes bacterium Pla133]QDV00005.1 Serine/threonine-protein kinase PknB [Planctomycetes bacterium Pla86]